MSVYAVNPSTGELSRVAGGLLYADMAVGSIVPFGGSTIPSGYLLCNGQAVSRTEYADLFSAIGTAFGSGDGSTTFNVPDLREAVPKGAGLTSKSSNHYDADGVALGEFIDDRIQGHEHKAYANATNATFTVSGGTGMDNRTSRNTNGIVTDGSNGDPRTGATTEVKAVGVNYIIKAVQSAVPIDLETAVDEKLSEVTSGTGTRNADALKPDSFTAKWFRCGKIVTVEVQGNTISNDIPSSVNLVTGFPKPITPIAVVGQGRTNTTVIGLVLKTDGALRSHYDIAADAFFHVSFSYITSD